MARIGIAVAALLKAAILTPLFVALADPTAPRLPYAFPGAEALADWLPVLFGAWLASAIALLVGWHTRGAAFVLFLALAAVLATDQQLYSNHIYLLLTLVGLLGLADAGAALSLDAARRGTRETVPLWPVTLLRLQVTIVYGFAAVAKLNLPFLSGGVLNAYLGAGLVGFPDALRTVEVMAPLSWGAILLEAYLALAIWSPRRRPAVFAAGFLFHAAIVLGVPPAGELVVFSIMMFSIYLLHLEATPRSRLVVWDDTCGFCSRWKRWIERLDWLAVCRFAPGSVEPLPAGITRAEAAAALQLVEPGGRSEGFGAVRRVCEFLPVSFVWAPLGRIGWIDRLGERVYRWRAERRSCAVTTGEPRRPARG